MQDLDRRGTSAALVRLIRPKQWIKNAFVFLPAFFGGAIFQPGSLVRALIVFVAFCLTASSIYCFNDIHDVDDDRRHPVKCHRPIASGIITVRQAYALMMVMLVLGLVVTLLLGTVPTAGDAQPGLPSGSAATEATLGCLALIGFYWLLNIAYCMRLKQYAIIDVCVVAFGFVLRLLTGGIATGMVCSKWIVLMTFLLTLFMSFAKRRDDVLRMEATGEAPRKNTIRYNREFMDQSLTITGSVMLVCYIMYTVSPEVMARFHSGYLYLTTIFVLVGLLRYIQLAVVDKKSGDPTKVLLRDRFIQLIVVAWVLSFLVIIYLL